MMCYRDMTFCSSDCNNEKCFRFFGQEQQKAADNWWGKPGAPIAMTDFSKTCKEYTNA